MAIDSATAARLTSSGQSGSQVSTPSDHASQGSATSGQSRGFHRWRSGTSSSSSRAEAPSMARSSGVAFGGSRSLMLAPP